MLRSVRQTFSGDHRARQIRLPARECRRAIGQVSPLRLVRYTRATSEVCNNASSCPPSIRIADIHPRRLAPTTAPALISSRESISHTRKDLLHYIDTQRLSGILRKYYQIINEAVAQRIGGEHSAACIVYSIDFACIGTCLMERGAALLGRGENS